MTSRIHVSTSQIEVSLPHLVQRCLVRVLGIDFCVQPSALEFVLRRQLHSSSFDLHLLVGQPGERHHGVIYSFYEIFLPRACVRSSLSAEAVRSLGRHIYHFGVHTRFIRVPNFSLVLTPVDRLPQRWNIYQQQQKKLCNFHGLVVHQGAVQQTVQVVRTDSRPAGVKRSVTPAGRLSLGLRFSVFALASPYGNHGERLGMVVDRSFLPGGTA